MRLGLSVPLYNEEALVEQVATGLIAALDEAGIPFRLALVNNGSADRTGALVDRLAADARVLPVHLAENAGYGGGILAGIQALQAALDPEILGWSWGDGQVDPAALPILYRQILAGADLAKARRTRRRTGWRRRAISAGYVAVMRALGVRTPDVNGCPKLIRREAWRRLAPRATDWFLDAEVVLGAEAAGLRLADAPVTLHPRPAGESKVRAATVVEFAKNLAKWRLGRGPA